MQWPCKTSEVWCQATLQQPCMGITQKYGEKESRHLVNSLAIEGIREFMARIAADPGWITTLVPIRDGLIVAYKRQS
jgi:hypothetical protein